MRDAPQRTIGRRPALAAGALTPLFWLVGPGAGRALACASPCAGDPLAWGLNGHGQLGDGTTASRTTPVEVSGATGLQAVQTLAGGQRHTLALDAGGVVWAWGANDRGQLGDGTFAERHTPGKVSGVGPTPIVIAAGADHALLLGVDGTVWAWGANGHGQLGDGTTTTRTTPVQVRAPSQPGGVLRRVVAIAAGFEHSLALDADGVVWAWGANESGQLGDGTFAEQHTPGKVSGVGGTPTGVAAGARHSLALGKDGAAWAWGANGRGQLGDDTTTDRSAPVRVSTATGLAGAKALAGGGAHSLALGADGAAWAWGANDKGQVGDATTADRHSPARVSGVGPTPIGIAAGAEHGLLLGDDGTVWAWGAGESGQLGDGGTANRLKPVRVQTGGALAGIGAGHGRHSLGYRA